MRLNQRVTKGPGSRAAGLALCFMLLEITPARRHATRAPHFVKLVSVSARFELGILVSHRSTKGAPAQSNAKVIHDFRQNFARYKSEASHLIASTTTANQQPKRMIRMPRSRNHWPLSGYLCFGYDQLSNCLRSPAKCSPSRETTVTTATTNTSPPLTNPYSTRFHQHHNWALGL